MSEAEVDYAKVSKELKTLLDGIGVKKDELQVLFDQGSANAAAEKKKKKAMDAVDTMVAALGRVIASTTLTDVERRRKIADLEADIESLEIIVSLSPDFNERMAARDEIARLSARLGRWTAQAVLKFEDLVDRDGNEIKTMIEEAARDIKARQDLARFLKGVEVALRAGVFIGAVAAKLSLAAVA